jgi:hypothetical protein
MSSVQIQAVKNLIRSNIPAYCVATMLSDAVQGIALSLGIDKRISGRGPENLYWSVEDTIAYEEKVFGEYMRYSGRQRFDGAVCEVGVGGDVGILLMILGAGAVAAHAVERFNTLRPMHEQRSIYSEIAERRGIKVPGFTAAGLPAGIELHKDATQSNFFSRRPGFYHAIFSASVMEHVGSPILLLNQMESALAAGGVMVHIIDLADHAMLGSKRHPLAFLTIPRVVYRRMVANSARPNRVMCHEYRNFAASPGRHVKVLVRRLIGAEELPVALPFEEIDLSERNRAIRMVQDIRPKLAAEFKSVSDEDLAVQEIVLIGNAWSC